MCKHILNLVKHDRLDKGLKKVFIYTPLTVSSAFYINRYTRKKKVTQYNKCPVIRCSGTIVTNKRILLCPNFLPPFTQFRKSYHDALIFSSQSRQ